MNCQIIPLLSLLLLTVVGLWRRWSAAFFICAVANIASFSLSWYWDMMEPYDLKSTGSMLFLGVCLCLFLYPISKMRFSNSTFRHPSEIRIRVLALFVVVLTVPATLYFLQYSNRIFSSDISAIRLEGKMSGGTSDAGLIHRYFMMCAYWYVIALALFLYSFVRKCVPRWMSILLLIGSMSYPLSGIYSYSRQMTMMYIVALFSMVFVLLPHCQERLRRILVRGTLTLVVISAVPLTYITIERFTGNERQGFYEYLGGGPRFFSRIYYHGSDWMRDPSLVFLRPYSLLWSWCKESGMDIDHDLTIYEENKALTYAYEDEGQPSAPFVTFCGTWLAEFSPWFTILVHMAFFAVACWYFTRCSETISLSGLMVCALYLTSGIFYPIGYLYVGTPGNATWLLIFATYVFLYYKSKEGSSCTTCSLN